MEGQNHRNNGRGRAPSTTPRDLLAVVFRRRRLILISFLGIFTAAILFWSLILDRYDAQMLILVDHGERTNPVVTPGPNAPPDTKGDVTEEEMNSEVTLLQSQELLEQVVVACGLDSKPGSLMSKIVGDRNLSREEKITKAVRSLANKLDVEVVKRTNIISVSYPSSDPQLAAQVVRTLSEVYLKKHAAVHRPTGQADFFQKQTEQYRKGLSQAEEQLVSFTRGEGVVSAQLEKEAALQKLSDFEAAQGQTQAAIAETQQRIRALESQVGALSPRLTTQVRTSDSAQLLQQLKATLLNLELKRTELLTKFEPDYRLVKEVETQIAQTRDAVAAAEKAQWREETTDRDPNFELVREELSKAQAELAGLEARAGAIAQTVRTYQAKARLLQERGIVQQDLIRNASTAEENYMLYLRKHEEARIADALDTRHIMNVTIAQAATVPVLPTHSNLWFTLVSILIAGLVAVGLAFVSDSVNPTLRTPDEVESLLNIPVLISVPKKANGRTGVHVS